MQLENITADNYKRVAEIYNEGISTGVATFETSAPDWESWDSAHSNFGRLVAVEDKHILGWAALSPVSSRCVYGGVAEISVYVAADARGKGVGKYLLLALIRESETNGIWTLQSGIFRANEASIKLHKKCGFRVIGYKEKIGKLHGEWKDNVLLERRSIIVGV